MAEGFLVDQGYGQIHSSSWQPGQPVKTFWGTVKQLKREQIKVSSWRCQRCGYLESYAVNQPG